MATRRIKTASKLSVKLREVNGMTDNEERILRKNVDEVQQNVETLQEMKIYNAMRKGIMEGKRRQKRRIYNTGIGVVATAAIALLITYSSIGLPEMGVAEHSVQSASTKNTDNFEAYRTSPGLEPALASALEQNLIIPIGQSAENNGYRVDVTGAVTDGRKVYILYNVQNNTEKEVIHANFKLQFEGIEELSLHKGATLDMLASDSRVQPGQSKDFIYSTNLSPSVKYPKEVNFNVILTETSEKALQSSSNKYRTSLDVAFNLYTDRFKEKSQTFNTNGTLTVDGQKIKVTQVQYTPLSTYVDLEYDQNNDKQISQLLNPVLISKQGNTTEKLYYPSMITSDNSEVYSDDSKFTLVFKDDLKRLHNMPDSVTLKVFGISAVKKDQMKIVVDLNNQEILEAPGTSLEWIKPTFGNSADSGSILFRQVIANSKYVKYSPTRVSETFTDAEGKVHTRSNANSPEVIAASTSSQVGSIVEDFSYYFGENATDYPQPLTITVEKFLNPIMDTSELLLLEKVVIK